MTRGVDVDEDIAFNSSAFSVVSSWLTGGKPMADAVDQRPDASTRRAPVQLYRPPRDGAANANANASGPLSSSGAKLLTKEEQEMKKKLLRKSGKYRHQLNEEVEETDAQDQDDALDREEEELMRYRHGVRPSKPDDRATPAPVDQRHGKQADTVSSTGAKAPEAPPVNTQTAAPTPKKRKLNAQEELIEQLREEAEKKKAKNAKAKQRMQRKKEQKRRQQEVGSVDKEA